MRNYNFFFKLQLQKVQLPKIPVIRHGPIAACSGVSNLFFFRNIFLFVLNYCNYEYYQLQQVASYL